MCCWDKIHFILMSSDVFAAIINSGDTGAHMICLLSDIVVNIRKMYYVLLMWTILQFYMIYICLLKQYNKNYLCKTLSENVSDLSVFD